VQEAFCRKPKPYGRGVGSTWPCLGCERWGLLWYPKCRAGFHNVACCICSPNCPNGTLDVGVSCTRESYLRPSTALQCEPGEVMDNDGLCYPGCRHSAAGVGPVCWGHCPNGSFPCGGALCLMSRQECTRRVLGLTVKVLEKIATSAITGGVVTVAKAVGTAVSGADALASLPECSSWHSGVHEVIMTPAPSSSLTGACSSSDESLFRAHFGVNGRDWGEKASACAKAKYNFWSADLDQDGFVTCLTHSVAGLREGCARCYAAVAKFGAQNCKQQCMLNWCSPVCPSCTNAYRSELDKCTGFSAPDTSSC